MQIDFDKSQHRRDAKKRKKKYNTYVLYSVPVYLENLSPRAKRIVAPLFKF